MAEREVKVIIRADDRSKSALGSATRGFQRLNKTVLGVAGTVLKAFAKIGIAATVAFGAFAALSVKTAIEVESAFAGVIKTTDGLVDEFGDLTDAGAGLKQEFRDLALEIPTDLPELMRLGEVGGQLGVARENLVDFTGTMAAMGEATDLTGEQAAVAFARIGNVMGTAQGDFDRMGSSVVALGNTFATNETSIVDFSQRIASAGEIAGLTEADVFGMAAAFSSVGVNAEAGGTAVQKVLIAMTQSVAEGGDQLDIFAATAGMSAEQFAAAFREDAAGAFTSFVTGLGEQGDDAFGTLEMLELQDQRLIRAFLSLAGAGDLLGETIKISNEAWDENTALAKEAEQRYNTLESQFALVKNIVNDVALSFGEALTPFIRDALKAALPFIKEFAQNLPDLLTRKVVPAIKDVVEWLGDKAVPALSDFVTWFKEKVLPALADFADFITMRVIPAIGKIVTWFQEKGIPAFDKFKAFLVVEVIPILAIIADWIEIKFIIAFSAFIVFLREKVIPRLETFVEQIVIIVKAIGDFVRDLQAGRDPMDAWSRLLAKLVPEEARIAILDITTKIADFVQKTIDFVKEHGPALQAALIAIGVVILSASVIGAIAGLIAAINPISLTIAAIAGVVALLAAAWTENWGGIRDKAEEVWAKLQPIFEAIKTWLGENIPIAVAALTKIWNETLLPAFEAVWKFIQDFLIPMWVAIVELGINFVKAEIAVFLKVWNTLKPAFEKIAGVVWTVLNVAFTIFEGILRTILQAIKDIITWITKLITKIGQIKLPDWLAGGASLGPLSFAGPAGLGLSMPSSMFAQGAGTAPSGPSSLSTGARIHIEHLNVTGSGAAGADVRNVVTMLEFGTRTV